MQHQLGTFGTSVTAPSPTSQGVHTFNNANRQQPKSTNPAAGITCYNYRQKGHYANDYPWKQAPSQVSSQAARSPAPSARGQVNHVAVEQESQLRAPILVSVQYLWWFLRHSKEKVVGRVMQNPCTPTHSLVSPNLRVEIPFKG